MTILSQPFTVSKLNSCQKRPLVFFSKEDIRFRPYYYVYEEQLLERISMNQLLIENQ